MIKVLVLLVEEEHMEDVQEITRKAKGTVNGFVIKGYYVENREDLKEYEDGE